MTYLPVFVYPREDRATGIPKVPEKKVSRQSREATIEENKPRNGWVRLGSDVSCLLHCIRPQMMRSSPNAIQIVLFMASCLAGDQIQRNRTRLPTRRVQKTDQSE